jgi:hypothetical protein
MSTIALRLYAGETKRKGLKLRVSVLVEIKNTISLPHRRFCNDERAYPVWQQILTPSRMYEHSRRQ